MDWLDEQFNRIAEYMYDDEIALAQTVVTVATAAATFLAGKWVIDFVFERLFGC